MNTDILGKSIYRATHLIGFSKLGFLIEAK